MSAGEEAADRTWALPVVAVLLVVVLALAGAWGYQAFLLGLGDTPDANVSAAASVQSNATAGTVTVAFTGNQNADYLAIGFAENGSAVRIANTSAGANLTDDGVRLPAVGDWVTYAERRPAENTTVEVVAVAADGDVRTVVLAKDVEL